MIADALRPSESDEKPHVAEATPLWGESWYFDFADPRQGIGGWIRLGLMPNEKVAWVCALVCGPQLPTVALLDFAVELPADPAVVHTDSLELKFDAVDPLQEYRVSVRGIAQAHYDPAALLRGECGDAAPLALAMDLSWTTVGRPYLYRLTPRYEIPCAVSGNVSYGDAEVALDAVPGQRDHSWGVRDWWGGLEWMWCALHLEDGRHLHAVDARMTGVPNTVIGYIQPSNSGLVELQGLTVEEAFADSGLPKSASICLEPGGVKAVVEVAGHAPVRLISASGRVSHFPRAWVTVTTVDGCTGTGWIEWNRLQPRS